MTVKQLRKHLSQFPQDAECVFHLWTASGENLLLMNQVNGRIESGNGGQQFAIISTADLAPAYRLRREEGKLLYCGEQTSV